MKTHEIPFTEHTAQETLLQHRYPWIKNTMLETLLKKLKFTILCASYNCLFCFHFQPPPPPPQFPQFPIRACILGKLFSGKSTCVKRLAQGLQIFLINVIWQDDTTFQYIDKYSSAKFAAWLWFTTFRIAFNNFYEMKSSSMIYIKLTKIIPT